jgi:putative FmdB family regulatory protein
MPIYEYHCKMCGNNFDIQASIAEKEKGLDVTCAQCGGKSVEQVLGGIAMLTGQAVKNAPRASNCGCSCGGNCD